MNKILALVSLTLLSIGIYSYGVYQTPEIASKFQSYTSRFNKVFTPAERVYRQEIYEKNLKIIEIHNSDPSQTYTMGENQFTDLTQEEFIELHLNLQIQQSRFEEYIPRNEAAPEVDWSTLTKVRQQGNCAAAWAFTAIDAVESVFRVMQDPLTPDLSVQQILDCDDRSFGCNGGWADSGLQFAAEFGLTTEEAYPFGVSRSCKIKTGQYKISGYKEVAASNLQKLITNYPVKVVVDAGNWSAYAGGVFSNCKKSLNHEVLAVGYYADGTWILKNSWGKSWGENGFIRLAAGDTCGVTQYATMAIL